jgi:hypothetical protein
MALEVLTSALSFEDEFQGLRVDHDPGQPMAAHAALKALRHPSIQSQTSRYHRRQPPMKKSMN